jgi:hypothetical protein
MATECRNGAVAPKSSSRAVTEAMVSGMESDSLRT